MDEFQEKPRNYFHIRPLIKPRYSKEDAGRDEDIFSRMINGLPAARVCWHFWHAQTLIRHK